jgi:ketosteroid isomerase-like protein
VAVVGAAAAEAEPGGGTRLVWLFTVSDGRLVELRTFRDTTS